VELSCFMIPLECLGDQAHAISSALLESMCACHHMAPPIQALICLQLMCQPLCAVVFADLDPEAAGLGDDGLLVPDLDPQLEALLGDGGAAGRMRGVAADIALDDGAYR
jgi:hypothetical protein